MEAIQFDMKYNLPENIALDKLEWRNRINVGDLNIVRTRV